MSNIKDLPIEWRYSYFLKLWGLPYGSTDSHVTTKSFFEIYVWGSGRVIIAVNFPTWAIGKKKPEKYQGFNGIGTRDLRDTGAMLHQLSYEATHWERGSYLPVQWNDVKYIWNNSYLSSTTAEQIWIISYDFTSFHCTGRYEPNKLTSQCAAS